LYLLLLRRLFVVVIVAVLYAPSTRGQTALASQLAASPTATPLPEMGATVAETERIVVTGSKIPTAEEVSANPALTIAATMSSITTRRALSRSLVTPISSTILSGASFTLA